MSSRHVIGLEHRDEVTVICDIQYFFWVQVNGSRFDVAKVKLFDPAHCLIDAKSQLRTYDKRRLLDVIYVSACHVGNMVMSFCDPDGDEHTKYVVGVPELGHRN